MPNNLTNKLLKNRILLSSNLIEILVFLLLIIATIGINLRMIRDGLNGMTDMKWHITWLQHFSKQLAEGIWYPRWLAGTNYGYGSPTFVFYPPLVYYLGSLIKFCGLNIENTITLLFSLALFLSGFNFYLFGRDRWGVIPSLVGALAYMTTPYLALDIYYRGGLSSIFVQAWLPLLWWFTDKSLKTQHPTGKIGLAICWAMIALTHTPSLLLSMLVWLPYVLFFLLKLSWKNIVKVIIFAGLGLGMASLYLFPAIQEKPLVNIETLKAVHNGFKAAILGSGLPFFPLNAKELVNIPYIFLHQSLVIIVLITIALVWCDQDKSIIKETWQWGIILLALAFMMSSLSLPIWSASETLQMVQFPWRFLQIFSFFGAALCAVVVKAILQLKLRSKLLLSLIIICILLVNFRYSYKLSRKFITIRNPGKGNVEHLAHIKTAINNPYSDNLRDVPEYRPLLKNNSSLPEPIPNQPKFSVIKGQAEIKLTQWQSYQRTWQVTAQESSTIRIRTYYYPAWQLYVNNQSHPLALAQDGTMEFNLQPGSYQVKLIYQWTKAFTIGVILSFLSFLFLVLYWFKVPVIASLLK